MSTLLEDRYYRLDVDDAGIMVLTRSPEPIADLDVFVASLAEVRATIERQLGPGGRGPGLLVDTRHARARNDEGFESRTTAYRQAVRDAFDRSAVLVASAVGKLHIARLDREEGTRTATFTDEAEAMAWLRQGDATPD